MLPGTFPSVSVHEPVAAKLSQRQRVAMVLGAVVTLILVGPLLDDIAHGRHLSWGDWLAELAFAVIGVSLAMGLVSAVRNAGTSRTTRLDVLRRRTFWAGVLLLPVAWLLPAILG